MVAAVVISLKKACLRFAIAMTRSNQLIGNCSELGPSDAAARWRTLGRSAKSCVGDSRAGSTLLSLRYIFDVFRVQRHIMFSENSSKEKIICSLSLSQIFLRNMMSTSIL